MGRYRVIPGSIAALAALALAGCAALRIDVDVYKGPLANHEDVQAQQFAVMAIGAKPLLIRLREILEGRDDGRCIMEVYVSTSPSKPSKGSCAVSKPQAIQVNAVLSLYQDQAAPWLEDLAKALHRFQGDYDGALRIFWPNENDAARWGRIEKGMRSGDEFIKAVGGQPSSQADVKRDFETLKIQYRRLLDPKGISQDGRDIRKDDKYERLRDNLDRVIEAVGKISKEFPNATAAGLHKDEDSDSEFQALSERDRVRAQAEYLFRDPKGEEAREFVRAVTEIAEAFIDSRRALRDLWLVSVRALIAAGSPTKVGTVDKRLVDRLAHTVAVLSQPRNLIVAINLPGFPGGVAEDLKARLAQASSGTPVDFWTPDKWQRDSKNCTRTKERGLYDKSNFSFLTALSHHPLAVAGHLLEADRFFTGFEEAQFPGTWDCLTNKYKSSKARLFGVVRGPTLTGKDREELGKVLDQLGNAIPALGFERGRLPQGLDTLIDDYVWRSAKMASGGAGNPELEGAARRLHEALVHYAEKVLFVANHEALFADRVETARQEIDRYVLILQVVGNSILVQADELRHRAAHRQKLADLGTAEVRAATRALLRTPEQVINDIIGDLENERDSGSAPPAMKQEIGNAIGVIERHRANVVTEASKSPPATPDVTLWILKQKLHQDATANQNSKDAWKIIKDRQLPLSPSSTMVLPTKDLDAREALDNMIAVLRHEHIQAVREAGADSGRAKRVKASIDTAYEHRQSMTYIRPASAYLRSSYAATGLQEDAPIHRWRNMLQAQTFRSLPILGAAFASQGERGRIVTEIDKQFWQNINSVRLAGGGDTNYVIAKDDIGNWYVKAYSTDIATVAKGVKNIALFGLGPTLGAPVKPPSGGAPQTGRQGQQTPAADQPGNSTPLERLLKNYQKDYATKTTNDREAVLALLDSGLVNRIKKAWQDDSQTKGVVDSKLEGILTDTYKKHLKERYDKFSAETDGNKAKSGPNIVRALQDIRHFHNVLIAEIGRSDAAATAKEAAQKEATRIVGTAIREASAGRRAAMKNLETAVVFIGEARGEAR